MTTPCYRYSEIIFVNHLSSSWHIAGALVDVSSSPISSKYMFWNSCGMQNDMNLSAGLPAFLKCPSVGNSSTRVLSGGAWKYVHTPLSDEAHLGSSFLLTCWSYRRQDITTHSCVCWDILDISCQLWPLGAEQLEGRADVSSDWEPVTEVRQPRSGLWWQCTLSTLFLDEDVVSILGRTVLCSVGLTWDNQLGLFHTLQDLWHPWLLDMKCLSLH